MQCSIASLGCPLSPQWPQETPIHHNVRPNAEYHTEGAKGPLQLPKPYHGETA